MKSLYDSLYGVSPNLANSLEILLIISVVVLIWIVASIPAAVLYAALGRLISRAANYFRFVALNFLSLAVSFWAYVSKLRDDTLDTMSLRYVYDHSESRLLAVLGNLKSATDSVGEKVQACANSLEAKITPLASEIKIISDSQQLSIDKLQLPELEVLKNTSRAKRNAIVMLVICVPIVVALVGVNTALLTKFFESFFEEFISYKLGIKWATMIGFLFSIIELALGVFFCHYSKEENRDSLLGPALKALFVFLVLALACIEGYLYMLLSADIAKQIKESNLLLPAGLEGMHSWWLAPFGFVVVITLALVGHAVMDSVNKAFEAGHLKELRTLLHELKSSMVRANSNWDSVHAKRDAAVKGLSEFNNDLCGNSNGVAGVLQTISQATDKMGQTVASLAGLRREPISTITRAEAAGVYRLHVFLVFVFVAVSVAFCWLQIHFLVAIPEFIAVDRSVFLLLAIVESAAIVFASYKAYPSVTSIVDGSGTEVLRSTSEKFISFVCLLIVLAAAVLILFLTRQESIFTWVVMYSLAIVFIGVLVLVGRTLPLSTLVAGVLIRQTMAALAALGLILGSGFTWFVHAVLYAVNCLLYFVAYPFLALFWRSQLVDPMGQRDSNEHAPTLT